MQKNFLISFDSKQFVLKSVEISTNPYNFNISFRRNFQPFLQYGIWGNNKQFCAINTTRNSSNKGAKEYSHQPPSGFL